MKKILTLGAISLVTSAILVGCGSSSDSESTTSDYLTGYFIDSPVANCEYVTSSGKVGRTNEKGEFQYKQGDKVKFTLGGLSLGETTPNTDGLITPETLTVNEESKVRLLQVLQALDSDNNPSNGITISDEVISSLEDLAQEQNINEITSDEELLQINDHFASIIDEDNDNVIDVSPEQAESHFENSIHIWDSQKGDSNGYSSSNGNSNNSGDTYGNGTQNGGQSNEHGNGDGTGYDVGALPKSELNQAVIDGIAYMGNEERLAYDVYTNLNQYHGNSINQFTNITKAERRHVTTVQDLVRKYNIDISTVQDVQNPVSDMNVDFDNMPSGKYDIQKIQDLYDALYAKGVASTQAALEVGCMVEVTDITDLDRYLVEANAIGAEDVIGAFEELRAGSYSHYWAFDGALKTMGISEGCGVVGSEFAKTPEEYPQEEKGHGNQNH